MQRIIVSVTNDLVTDQRVHKVCSTLVQMKYDVILIGRKLPNSLPLTRNYRTIRMNLIFKKKVWFYAEYNMRLFIKLLFLKKDILLSNDLDTLLPNFLISKLLGKKLVYDSHELFTEIGELIDRPRVQKAWLTIEKFIFPKLKNVYTVNRSIADIYSNKYGVDVNIIRNIAPKLQHKSVDISLANEIKGDKKMLILQGSGINIDRGAEEAVKMMKYLENTILYIIGSGDVFEDLKRLTKSLQLEEKVVIKGKLPYLELMEYTKIADLGLSLDKATNLNYEFSLPNKVFDYIQAETPLLVSNRKEVANLVKENNIGWVIDDVEPKKLAEKIKQIVANTKEYATYKQNLKKASEKYTWESEQSKLVELFKNLK
ncbi:glycosyltransferase family 4 protein [Aureibaculum algae]|uniref:Glycosyltransferase family 4 protein n=1 Tax=Aureibaculum algae TaxID=2584122 RepID=A0A5B7TZW7_9FLAO|nr:glycosyltransferase [Aureibaculum algae]QCX40954.1 glycosyltransferase family 4 protein [Aureibaculum algae]